MKIVQLEAQGERSLSAKQALERQADVSLVQTESFGDFLRVAAEQDTDLFLCSHSDLLQGGPDAFDHLRLIHPHVPVVLVANKEDRAMLLRDPELQVWDVVLPYEFDRLHLSILRAIESRRRLGKLQAELLQANDLLVACQKNISIGRLLGTIAHEINNPLEAISNLLYLGQRNVSDENEIRRCLQMAEEELQRVGEITKQMLHFHRDSKLPQEVSLSEVIESVLVLYQNRLEMRGIRGSKRYRSHARLIAHPGELRQAFSNFVANAIDAMPQGGTLHFRIRGAGRCRLSVTISDSGSGISREQIRHLGELLFTTKGEAGTGLGLWVTFRIIAKYGGAVRVYSSTRLGKSGTTFRLCFADPARVVEDSHPDGATQMSLKHRTHGGEGDLRTEVDRERREKTG